MILSSARDADVPAIATMQGQPAKVLGAGQVRLVLNATKRTRHPARNRVIVLLSVKAGLRACEIAGLTWSMVTNAAGSVGTLIELPARAAKKGGGRRIPLHPELRRALTAVRREQGPDGTAVVRSERGGPMTAKAVVDWFADVYRSLGLEGCSSHSGRRTFVTRAARLVQKSAWADMCSSAARSSAPVRQVAPTLPLQPRIAAFLCSECLLLTSFQQARRAATH